MVFKKQGPWNTEKYCRPPWLAGKKIFWIIRCSRIAKTVTFWPWWQPLNSFSFLFSFAFLFFAMQKSGEAMPHAPRCYRTCFYRTPQSDCFCTRLLNLWLIQIFFILFAIWDALHDLVPFVQLKKREKSPIEE